MEKKAQVVLATGGTGGHLYPAWALAGQLRRVGLEPLFVGSKLGNSPYFEKGEYQFAEVSSGPLSIRKPLGMLQCCIGTLQAYQILRRHRPKLVVGFGGYASAPVLMAARLARVPILLHEGNAVPGKVTRLFARWAKKIAIHLPPAAAYLKAESVETAMPLRYGQPLSQGEALHHFGLGTERFTVLVFGGSQGASRINKAFVKALSQFPSSKLQVIHLTGESARPYEEAYARLGIPAYVAKFEPKMDLAWSAADLAVMRAGACSIAEQIEWEVPAILVPFPEAAHNHQEANARFITDELGGGITLLQTDFTPAHISDALHTLVHQSGHMSYNLRQYRGKPRQQLLNLVQECITSSE